MSFSHPRLIREQKTITAMIRLYCRDQHGSASALCPECAALLDYATIRLEKCPFQEEKPTCARCAVHCYQPAMRQKVREVMRYAGPRMLLRHPLLTIQHLLDGRRETPALPRRKPASKQGE